MKTNVAVVFGGRSVEHEISIISALQAIAALDRSQYQPIPIYITKNGHWYTGDELLETTNYYHLENLLNRCTPILINQNSGTHSIYKLTKYLKRRVALSIDIVLPVIHGTNGEDGTLQGLFTTMNIPYVGCDTLAAAISMDKITTKMVLQTLEIPILDYLWFYSEQWLADPTTILAAIQAKFTYPLIVKPSNLGSSIGILAAKNQDELEAAIDLATRLSRRFLVEPQITNLREINCALLGDHERVELSLCEELLRTDTILTYQDKYLSSTTKVGRIAGGFKGGYKSRTGGMSSALRKIPADIPEHLLHRLEKIARKAFIALNCSGVARIDFLLDQTTENIYLCELNTIPGSLAFYLWEPLGKTFSVLLDQLLSLAVKNHRKNNRLITTYADNILAAGRT